MYVPLLIENKRIDIMKNMKKSIFLGLLAVFFAWMGCVAQTLEQTDSLLRIYEQSKGNMRTTVGKKLLKIYAESAVFFHEAPTLDGKMGREEQDLQVWFGTERFYTTNSYFAEALTYIERALPLAQTRDTDIYATLLCDKSYCLFKTSDYTAAIEAAQQAKEECKKTKNWMQLSRAYLYLALVNHSLRNYEEAKNQVVKSIETNAKLGLNPQTHNVLGVACELFCSAQEVDKAIEYGKQAVEAARQMDYQPAVANHLTQLSYAYDRKGEYQLGLDMANEAIAIVKANDPLDRNQLAITLEFKGWNLIDLKRNKEAVEALREAIQLEEAVGNVSAVRYDYRTLSEALEPIDPHEALVALRRCLTMTDSIHTTQLRELTTKANAELHNDELQEENAQGRRRTVIITLVALVMVLLLLAVIASLWFAFRQKSRTNQALQRLTEAREHFFTNVTHEFRTPLTVILGLSHEMQKNAHPIGAEQLKETGETIERQGTQLLALVNQLLDISKVKSAIGEQPQRTGDVAAYVGMVVETQRELARQRNIRIDYEREEDALVTTFVPDYMQKVVQNLLSNAIKFTPEGGKVTVSLSQEGKKPQKSGKPGTSRTSGNSSSSAQLTLCVSDTGRGIEPKDLPHIFEPFYQADTSGGMGSGVGLALTKQIVDALDGKIDVGREGGKGTTFRVTLPLVEKEAAGVDTPNHPESPDYPETPKSPENPETPGNPNPGTPILLVVEDNQDVAQYIAQLLKEDYEIHFAANGREGIEKARNLIPDLIITDLMMPGTDGLELCHTLRQDESTDHIPLIVVTAKVREEDRIRGLEAGADAYLNKPFNAEELRVRIEKLLETRERLRKKYHALVEIDSKETEEETADTSFPAHSDNFIRSVKETIQRLLPNNCSVEELANELCMSSRTLQRKINTVAGVSPKKFITEIRIKMARQMMEEHPERTITDVAERCGFYDHTHFARIFRKEFGISPGQFQQEQQS